VREVIEENVSGTNAGQVSSFPTRSTLRIDHGTGITMSSPDLELTIDTAVAVTSDLRVRVPVPFSYACSDPYAVRVSAAGLGDGSARRQGPVAPGSETVLLDIGRFPEKPSGR